MLKDGTYKALSSRSKGCWGSVIAGFNRATVICEHDEGRFVLGGWILERVFIIVSFFISFLGLVE